MFDLYLEMKADQFARVSLADFAVPKAPLPKKTLDIAAEAEK